MGDEEGWRDWIIESLNCDKGYDEMIRESVGRRDGSGLGLARILAESEMELRYSIDQGALIIIAEITISERAPS